MIIRGVLETCLYVDDLDKAQAFYTRILGLPVLSRDSDRHLFFRCGEGVLLLFNPLRTRDETNEVPPHGSIGPGHVAFNVDQDDLPKWKNHLLSENISIEKEIIWPSGGHSIYFRDPYGNSLEFTTPQTWDFSMVDEKTVRRDKQVLK